MARPVLAIAVITLFVVTAGVTVASDGSQEATRAEILVGDLIVGDADQRLGPMRAFGFDEDVEELVIEIDLTVLETHGVDIGGASIDLTDDDVQAASVVSATVEDGIVTLVFAPTESASSTDSLIVIDAFQLSGLDTDGAEGGADLTFDASFSEGDAAVHGGFDIIDPDATTPTVTPDPLVTTTAGHAVPITGLQPADEPITVELNTTVLEAHGIGVDNLAADVDTAEATVHETTVEHGIVTAIVEPNTDTPLFDVVIELRGYNTTGVDTDERVAATNITFDVRIDGDADDHVDVHGFDIITEPPPPETRHLDDPTPATPATNTPDDETSTVGNGKSPDDDTTPVSEEAHGFGIVITVIALIGSGLLGARYL